MHSVERRRAIRRENNYTVCRRVRAAFSSDFFQAVAVKGLTLHSVETRTSALGVSILDIKNFQYCLHSNDFGFIYAGVSIVNGYNNKNTATKKHARHNLSCLLQMAHCALDLARDHAPQKRPLLLL